MPMQSLAYAYRHVNVSNYHSNGNYISLLAATKNNYTSHALYSLLLCTVSLHRSVLHFSRSVASICKLQPEAAERQYEAGLVGCLVFSPASVSLINSWLSSVTNVSLPSSSPEEEEEEEEFLMFSLFYGSMFAAGFAVCVRVCDIYTIFVCPFPTTFHTRPGV